MPESNPIDADWNADTLPAGSAALTELEPKSEDQQPAPGLVFAEPEPPKPAAIPVEVSERVATVDVIRGFALLGILLMNILSFSWPHSAYERPTVQYIDPRDDPKVATINTEDKDEDGKEIPRYKSTATVRIAAVRSNWDVAEWAVARVFAAGKMMTLFSMLFGAGLVLMSDRADRSGRRLGGIYYRRLFWLLVIGALHGYFVWHGDILFMYAAIGLYLYPLRNLGPRWLLGLSFGLWSFTLLCLLGASAVVSYSQSVAPKVEAYETAKKAAEAKEKKDTEVAKTKEEATEKGEEAKAEGDSPAKTDVAEAKVDGESRGEADVVAKALAIGLPEPTKFERMGAGLWSKMRPRDPYPERVGHEIAIYRGGFAGIVADRAGEVFGMQMFSLVLAGFLTFGWIMLLGMGLMKLGVFAGQRSDGFYKKLLLAGYGVGLPLATAETYLEWHYNFRTTSLLTTSMPMGHLATPLVALGHAAALILLYRAGVASGLMARLSAVGRMALTNYLTHSIFFTTLFFGYGFGLYGTMPRVALVGMVVAMWAFQLWMSPIWLRHFKYGPAEWLWRSLTYWKLQPMRYRLATPEVPLAFEDTPTEAESESGDTTR